jgi:hypothetical protein
VVLLPVLLPDMEWVQVQRLAGMLTNMVEMEVWVQKRMPVASTQKLFSFQKHHNKYVINVNDYHLRT